MREGNTRVTAGCRVEVIAESDVTDGTRSRATISQGGGDSSIARRDGGRSFILLGADGAVLGGERAV